MSRCASTVVVVSDVSVSMMRRAAMAPISYLEGRIRLGWSDQLGSRTAGDDYARLRQGLSQAPVE